MGAIYSFAAMYTQVLREMRHPGDATMKTDVKAWLNEAALQYAQKWDFPSLRRRWKSALTSDVQYDDTLPKLITRVPRDIVKPIQAHLLDKTVDPYKWYPLEIIPMQEFDRKFRDTNFADNPGRPTHMTLRQMQEHVFLPSEDATEVGFTETFEGLSGDLDGENNWSVASPAYTVLSIDAGSEMTGTNSLACTAAGDDHGYPYKHDVPVAQAYGLTWNTKLETFATNGNALIYGTVDIDMPVVRATAPLHGLVPWAVRIYKLGAGAGNVKASVWSHGTEIVSAVDVGATLNTVFASSLAMDRTGQLTVIVNGVTVCDEIMPDPTIRAVNALNVSLYPYLAAADIWVDDFVYTEVIPPSEWPTNIIVKSDETEDATLKVSVNFFADPERQILMKKENAITISATPETLYTGLVYGIIGIGKSAYSTGQLSFYDTYDYGITELMPHEINAIFPTLAFGPLYPDQSWEFHLIYKARPPIMTLDGDTTFLLHEALQGAIIQSAIVRGLKYLEDNDWQAAQMVQDRLERNFVADYMPELIEEAHTYLVR